LRIGSLALSYAEFAKLRTGTLRPKNSTAIPRLYWFDFVAVVGQFQFDKRLALMTDGIQVIDERLEWCRR
jgi:hypothetical protein